MKVATCLIAFAAAAMQKQTRPNKSLADGQIDRVAVFEVEMTSDGDTSKLGTISLGLFGSELPRTVDNFEWACTEHYADTVFHRVIQNFMAQGGDFTNHNGTGGRSKYGSKFADESFVYKHDKPGALSMANAGPDTNGSQFFVTFEPTPWLDGRHVVFGCVVDGFNTLTRIEARGSASGRTDGKIKIKSCSIQPAKDGLKCSIPDSRSDL